MYHVVSGNEGGVVSTRNLVLTLRGITNLDLNGVGIISKTWDYKVIPQFFPIVRFISCLLEVSTLESNIIGSDQKFAQTK